MTIPIFSIKETDDGRIELRVGRKEVGSFNHDEHGWISMVAAANLFEATAKAVGAKFERR